MFYFQQSPMLFERPLAQKEWIKWYDTFYADRSRYRT